MSELPPYVERASKQTFIPPYLAKNARIYGFILRSDFDVLQALCDTALNRPTGGNTDYRPALPLVFLTFADIESLSSINPPDSRVGWLPERDVALWVLTVTVSKKGGIEFADGIAFYQPYLFVDAPQALLTGREVQGFPKEYSTVDMTRKDGYPGPMSVRTHVFPEFSPTTECQVRELMTVSQVPGSAAGMDLSRFGTMAELLAAVWKELRSGEEPIAVPDLKFMFSLGEELLKAEVPCVFLKQFRDVVDGSRACYQAVVGVPMRITGFHGAGLMPGRYSLDLANFQSHPIASNLGLTPPAMASMLGGYIDIDFVIDRGSVIWEAATARGGSPSDARTR
jgi:hypothetical protein